MICFTITTGRDPYSDTYSSIEFSKSDRTISYWIEKYERYLTTGEVTCYRFQFYALDDEGKLSFIQTHNNKKLKTLPRTINKKNDKHNSPITAEALSQNLHESAIGSLQGGGWTSTVFDDYIPDTSFDP
jgi:hypothetical protein